MHNMQRRRRESHHACLTVPQYGNIQLGWLSLSLLVGTPLFDSTYLKPSNLEGFG
jgi:hypothetical protein